MEYKKFVTGPIDTNTYIIPGDDGACLIVDPSSGCHEVLKYLGDNALRPLAVLLTHGHFDHIMGVSEIHDVYPDTQVYIHPGDMDRLANPTRNGSPLVGAEYTLTKNVSQLSDGQMNIGQFNLTVLYVPGHTQGGCAFVFDDVCFCGDTIFANSVGRTDLPGGDHDQLIKSIREKILPLPPKTVLCPGHGGRTTVEREARSNPYL